MSLPNSVASREDFFGRVFFGLRGKSNTVICKDCMKKLRMQHFPDARLSDANFQRVSRGKAGGNAGDSTEGSASA
jgi:hypothetical protein